MRGNQPRLAEFLPSFVGGGMVKETVASISRNSGLEVSSIAFARNLFFKEAHYDYFYYY